jgi:hypothetical protein
MGWASARWALCSIAAGLIACSGGAAAPQDATSDAADAASEGGLTEALCSDACAVVIGAGCAGAPTQADCVSSCLDWPLPCGEQSRLYGECIIASGSEAFTCDQEAMGTVIKPGYCETEGRALDTCVGDNLPFANARSGRSDPWRGYARMFNRVP